MAEWEALSEGGEWGVLPMPVPAAKHHYTYLGPWGRIDLAASLTDSILDLGDAGSASERLVQPFPGFIRGISVRTVGDRTAGTATFTVQVQSVSTSLAVVLDATNPQTNYSTAVSGVANFAAGQHISVVATTTAAWAPITADVAIGVWVEYA